MKDGTEHNFFFQKYGKRFAVEILLEEEKVKRNKYTNTASTYEIITRTETC
jgi:hypothetical protein